jgi:prepilin-type processing-associated H-X9-DG protein
MVELLVVMAIIGTLVGLLLIAIQKVRESANRTVCANNLHQLALAMHAYQAAYNGLPPNYAEDESRTDGSHNLFYGPLVRVLPFLEVEPAYRNFSFLYYDSTFPDPQGIGWPSVPGAMSWKYHCWIGNPFNRPPQQTTGFVPPPDPLSCPNPTGRTNVPGQTWGGQGNFKVFACPSQPFDRSQVSAGNVVTNYLHGLPGGVDMPRGNPYWYGALPQCVDSNTTWPSLGCTIALPTYAPGNYVLGACDYAAVLGAFHDASFTDPPMPPEFVAKYRSLFNYKVYASLDRVPDGASNTIMLAEFAGLMHQGDPDGPQYDGWIHGGWASNAVSVAFGTCPDPNNAGAPPYHCDFSPEAGGLGSGLTLGGWHQGTFQVAFADGSVRRLRLGLPKMLLFALAGFADGEDAPFDAY